MRPQCPLLAKIAVLALFLALVPSQAEAQLNQFTLEDIDLMAPGGGAVPGEIFRYRAVLESSGTLSNASFRFVPPLTTIVAGTATTTQGTIVTGLLASDTSFEVQLGTLTGGSPVTLEIDVRVIDPYPACTPEIVAQASMSADGIVTQLSEDADMNSLTTETMISTATAPSHLITVTEAVPNGTADPGELLSYRIDVEIIGDAVPQELRWESLSLSNASLVVGSVTVSNPAVSVVTGNSPGDTSVEVLHPTPSNVEFLTVRFDAVVDNPPAAGETSVTLDGIFSFPCFVPNSSSLSLPLPGTPPDLTVAKTDFGAVATPGGLITYTLRVENVGASGATGVQLRDVVPDNTTFSAAGSDPGWLCFGVNCRLILGTVAAGSGPQSYVIAFAVDDPLAAGVTEIQNTATVTDDGANGADPTPANNSASETTPVDLAATGPDLTLLKSDGGVIADAGEVVVYSLTLANVGNQHASGVKLSDSVPPHTTFDASSSSAGWSCGGGLCSLPVGDVFAGAAAQVLTIAFQIDSPLAAGVTEISNTVIAADDGVSGPDLNPADNTSTDTTPVGSGGGTGPDLQVVKSDGGANADAGDVVAYTLTLANAGNQHASGVTLSDNVPPHTTFDASSSSAGWSCGGGLCSLPVGDVLAGAAAQVYTIAFQIDSPLAAGVTEISNTAVAADDGVSGPDLNPADNTSTDTTPVGGGGGTGPDLQVFKSDGGASADAGDVVVYTLTLSNAGNQHASGVTLSDNVPPHTTFDASSSSAGWSCGGGLCSLSVGDVLAGAAAQVYTIAFQIDSPLAAGVTEISNTVIAADDGSGGGDLNPADNTSTDTTPVGSGGGTGPDLQVLKDDGAVSVDAGELLIYTLTVSNVGNQHARGVVLSDVIPQGTSFDAAESDAGWSCPEISAGSICTLDLGDLDVGAEALSVILAVRLDDPLGSGLTVITNTATVADDGSGGVDLNPADNSATEQTPVGGGTGTGPDLVATKDDGEVAVDAGDLLIYTLTVSNIGNQHATGVVLSDVIPPGDEFRRRRE